MKIVSWIVLVPVAVAVIVFAVSNREATEVDFWPTPYSFTLPLFSVVLGSVLVGFCLGAATAWISAAPRRWRERALARDLAKAERELALLNERLASEDASAALSEQEPRALTRL